VAIANNPMAVRPLEQAVASARPDAHQYASQVLTNLVACHTMLNTIDPATEYDISKGEPQTLMEYLNACLQTSDGLRERLERLSGLIGRVL
jgi:hypothetical protein